MIMDKENINLTINGDVKNPIEIVLREGEAIKHQYLKKYTFNGVISAPRDFSKMITNKGLAVVEFSYKDQLIKILEDPTDADGAEVTGKISINPDLVAFGINKDVFRTSSELIKHARKYAHCFKSPQEAKDLIVTLQNFEVKFEQTHKKEDDRKGNTEDMVKNAIKFHKGEVKSEIELSIPLFIGSPKVDFKIEVEIERQGTTPVFGFYSITMESINLVNVKSLIDAELEVLRKDFTCLQLS
jgi:hypothetical protein